MGFFGSSFFWFIEGIFACLAIIALRIWAQDKGIRMPFWKWPAIIAWVTFVAISIAFVGTSIGEGESNAAFFGAVSAAVIASISGVVVWRLLRMR